MNWFFWLLVIIGLVIVWLTFMSFAINLGRMSSDVYEYTKEILTTDFSEEEHRGEK